MYPAGCMTRYRSMSCLVDVRTHHAIPVQQRSTATGAYTTGLDHRGHPNLPERAERIIVPTVRDEEAAGSNPATPTEKHQVRVSVLGRTPALIPFSGALWRNPGEDLGYRLQGAPTGVPVRTPRYQPQASTSRRLQTASRR